MKPLILLTLIVSASVCAHGQTIADAARQERARQAQTKSTKVLTSEDVKTADSAAPAPADANKPPNIKDAAARNPKEGGPGPDDPEAVQKSAPAAPAVDPVQKWTEETGKLRAKVRDLMDQETETQLQVNTASGQINAPVTNQSAKDLAQKNLDTAQKKLAVIRNDLAKVREELRQMDLQGPPQKKQ